MLADADRELTLRGILLGAALTFVFTAANVYLGLKVGLTFGTSIPAAVISMAVLGVFAGANIRENNIVQTVCSAAGAMASIIFVMPGLVIVGWWTGFPFWPAFLVCAAGGVLGVLFTIPLRRALVTNSDLPYPEGVAGAEVLKVGAESRAGGPQAREGLLALIWGSLASTGFAIAAAMRLVKDVAEGFFRVGAGASGYSFSFSLALVGAGHLVGISVGVAMLLGILIAWAGVIPVLTGHTPQAGELGEFVTTVWRTRLRYIGAGAMGVAAIWSLLRTIGPIAAGFMAMIANRARPVAGDQTDRDIPLWTMALLGIGATVVAAALTYFFVQGTPLAGNAASLALITIPIMLLWGFLVAAICGYMAGLIGSSNSPISGVGILAVTGCAVILAAAFSHIEGSSHALIATALFITSMLFAGACSSNDNLQDLKTGQLVGASPWRQQIALIVGVLASALVIPPVLNLLSQAYGFAGAPNLNVITAQPLAAPQANLISALAQGVIGHSLDWSLIRTGMLIGAGIVALDELCRWRGWLRLPPLAVGLGIYLPMSATLPVCFGAVIGWLYDRTTHTERTRRLGVLVASGMIVGESLFGVLNAGLIVGIGRDAPLGVVGPDFAAAPLLGLLLFLGLTALLYGWMLRRGRRHPA